jgi:hypothetical protein
MVSRFVTLNEQACCTAMLLNICFLISVFTSAIPHKSHHIQTPGNFILHMTSVSEAFYKIRRLCFRRTLFKSMFTLIRHTVLNSSKLMGIFHLYFLSRRDDGSLSRKR